MNDINRELIESVERIAAMPMESRRKGQPGYTPPTHAELIDMVYLSLSALSAHPKSHELLGLTRDLFRWQHNGCPIADMAPVKDCPAASCVDGKLFSGSDECQCLHCHGKGKVLA